VWIYFLLAFVVVIALRTKPLRGSPFLVIMAASVLVVGFESIRHHLL